MEIILVTGGAGFIGSHLCERLLEEGKTVVAIDSFNDFYDPTIKERNIYEIRKSCNEKLIPKERFIVEKGDIRDQSFLMKVFQNYQFQSVIHLAAYAGVRPSIQNPELYVNVNINGTMNILECLREYRIKRFIFASSSSVYGNNEKVPFSEDDSVDQPISPYAATKKAGELLCYTYHHLYNLSVACLRFFTVYGPRQRPDLAIHKFTNLITSGKPVPFYGDGTTQRDYTYIDDIVDGILKALDWVNHKETRYGIFNLGESKTISLSEMVQELEKNLQKKAQLDSLPDQPGDVKNTYADIMKSKQLLGYQPTTMFSEGIKKFVSWYYRY
ncbi:SDR family NAD(P)-dependent oxidoreductase [Dehalobacter restrictus]|uniref:Epimerase n=1 Tax=Dehalobacter restrictus (strain DSM 9455 / PER-K23) TaxID=871738 RepID=A0ABM5P6V2_DEHRP|nr:SDR family NAD(P)-dependent oxidoreductase [Dehalobacter restrictus]AHF10349.1 epimerase [Dehalobacter restrictus DSM 9455]